MDGRSHQDSRGALRAASRFTDNRVYDEMGCQRIWAETSHEAAGAAS